MRTKHKTGEGHGSSGWEEQERASVVPCGLPLRLLHGNHFRDGQSRDRPTAGTRYYTECTSYE